MQQEIDREVFKGVKLVLSTPTMGMQVCEQYADSRAELERWLFLLGVSVAPHRVRDTYLPRARNVLAAEFLATDAEWQLSLDSDMGFDVPDVIRMLYHALTNPEIEVIGAPYPQKHFDWPRVKEAVTRNPDISHEQLACCATGAWTFKGVDGTHNLGAPIELVQVGDQKPHVATGVLLIKRGVYERLKEETPKYVDARSKKAMWRFFHADVEGDKWVGEDTWFCWRWHDSGGRLWLAPWVKSEHIGVLSFRGDVSKIVDAGMELPA